MGLPGSRDDEIVAIPKLLNLLGIEGAVVTIHAMGCQRDIAKTIIGVDSHKRRSGRTTPPGTAAS